MFAGRFRTADGADYFRTGWTGGPRIGRRTASVSLINDALKRASQAKPSPPAHQQSEPQLLPVEHKRSPVVPLLFLIPVLLLLLALAGWLFIKAWRTESRPKFSPIKLPVSAREAPAAQPIGSFGAPQQNNGFKPEPPSPQPAGSA